jgi:hypothetical protein
VGVPKLHGLEQPQSINVLFIIMEDFGEKHKQNKQIDICAVVLAFCDSGTGLLYRGDHSAFHRGRIQLFYRMAGLVLL